MIRKIALLFFLLFFSFSQILHAQLATNLGIGVAGSMGNAVTADPLTITGAIHFNPAALTRYKGGFHGEANTIAALFAIEADFSAPPGYEGVFGNKDHPALLRPHSESSGSLFFVPGLSERVVLPGLVAPLSSFAINSPGSKFTFGNALFAPQAVGYARDSKDSGRFQGNEIALQRITYLSPTVAYEINDHWSAGVSIGFSHQAVVTNLDFIGANEILGLAELFQDAVCQNGGQLGEAVFNICFGDIGPYEDIATLDIEVTESLSPTVTLGLLWEPNDRFAWGVKYQFAQDMKLKGDFLVEYDPDFYNFFRGFNESVLGLLIGSAFSLPAGDPVKERGHASIDLTYPAHFQTGIKFKPTEKLQINFDLTWVDYDAWEAFDIEFDRPLQVLGVAQLLSPGLVTPSSLSLPRNYESVWSPSIGVEYQLNERMRVRAGYEMRNSAIPANRRDVLAPLGKADFYGLGFGYQWDKDSTLDLSVSYLISKQKIPANSSQVANSEDFGDLIYNPYNGLDIDTKVSAWILGLTFRTKF